jgi:hypothetical protein
MTEQEYRQALQVEGELEAFIERRHDHRVVDEGERPAEALWAASERRYFARLDEERSAELVDFHKGQARRLRAVLESLIAHHEEQAAKLGAPLGGDAA